jgi:ribonuclease E
MPKKMLINSVTDQECRIAVTEDGVLQELYVERASSASHVGNIYKGRVVNVEASIQAAFIDFGLVKNGFLHISDLYAHYFPKEYCTKGEPIGRKHPHRDRPPIQQCLNRGQEVVVQMTKEGIGSKGPTLTTYLSIPGRLLVMMPNMTRLGVSRKVEDEDVRDRAREALGQLELPPEIGFIVRTAGVDRPKRELRRDLNYLLRLWKSTSNRIKSAKAPTELYRESDLVIRTIRDIYNSDIQRIVCDDPAAAQRVREFLNVAMPRTKNIVEIYTGTGGLFHDTGLDDEIEKIHARRIELPSGGSLVIEQTEALVAIDVNSGRSRQHSDAETTAMKTNIEAAREIARQLRLRDLGGVVVMDYIDMREENNRRTVEKVLREAMKSDRAKTRLLHINSFGILEMTRQRLGPSLKHSFYRSCTSCDGSGLIKSEESQALAVMRILQRACSNENIAKIEITISPPVAHYLANCQRQQIAKIEAESTKTIIIAADRELSGSEARTLCTNIRGSKVAWEGERLAKDVEGGLQTVDLDEYLKDHSLQTPPADQEDSETPDQPATAKPSKKPRRRRRRGGQKRKAAAPSDVQESADQGKDDSVPRAAKEDKPAKSQPKATPKSKTKKASAKTGRRTRQARKPAAKKPESAKAQTIDSAGDQPPDDITIPPARMLEAIAAERKKSGDSAKPAKTLLEAMGLEDNSKKTE